MDAEHGGGGAPYSASERIIIMSHILFPAFLMVSLAAWGIFLVIFAVALGKIKRVPDKKILDYKAQTIEVKKRLGIKVYKF